MMLTGYSTTLNLGLDPSLHVDFETVREERDEPGVFSKILTLTRVFEARLRFSASANGPIEVLVEDVIPVPRDDRLKVAAIEVHKGALGSEMDLKDRKERGSVAGSFVSFRDKNSSCAGDSRRRSTKTYNPSSKRTRISSAMASGASKCKWCPTPFTILQLELRIVSMRSAIFGT